MRWIKSIVLALALIASLVVTPAAASSQYDNVVNSVTRVKVEEGMSSCFKDITNTWATDIRSFLSPSLRASFDGRAASGVSLKIHPGGDFPDIVVTNVYWWDDQDLPDTATFTSGNKLTVTPTYRGSLSIWHDGEDCILDGFGANNGSSPLTIAEYDPHTAINTVRPLFISGIPIEYPLGYTGEEIAESWDTPTKYVAMGDSYSSGEGVLPYETGTDSGSNNCHRSVTAYPRLIQNTYELSETSFVACSGAISDYIIKESNQENVEPPQAIYVTTDTDLVTISIGGNDVGFADALRACTAASIAQACKDAIDTASDRIADPSFLSDVTDVLTGIRMLGGHKTNVIALGYPHLFPAYENISGDCTWGSYVQHLAAPNVVSNRTITKGEIDAIRKVHDDLNNVIFQAVVGTFDSRVYFADPSAMFAGHEVCGTLNTWIHGVTPILSNADIGAGSFHPNQDGQAALAAVIEAQIANLD